MLTIAILVGVLSKPYFTKPVFYIAGSVYKLAAEQGDASTYEGGNPPVAVKVLGTGDPLHREVAIEGMTYEATRTVESPVRTYEVVYPSGTRYMVKDQNGMLLTYDEQGNMDVDTAVFVNGERVLQEGEELYPPASIVSAAYPEYHETRGTPWVLFIALGVLVFGLCVFRYRALQTALFWLSPRNWIYVEDPEPNDFYYFMSKVGGVVVMIVGIALAFLAY